MISGKKYSIPPGGMVLKDRLQLGNMWRSDHLSRKQTRRELRELRRNNDTFRLDLLFFPVRDEINHLLVTLLKARAHLALTMSRCPAMIDEKPLVLRS